jgi:Uma2 family endonuclease
MSTALERSTRAPQGTIEGFSLEIPAEAHTLSGFRTWALSDDVPEKLPVCFIQGRIIVDMSKEVISSHAAVKTAIVLSLDQHIQSIDFGEVFIDGVLVSNVEAKVSNNPDMVAISWASLKSNKVRYVEENDQEAEIEGSPDWILEIVSNSSVKKDTRDLRHSYHKAGVREYWIVDARGEHIDFQILHWRKAGYVAAPDIGGWRRSRVFSRDFQLTRKRHRRVGWQYMLSIRDLT